MARSFRRVVPRTPPLFPVTLSATRSRTARAHLCTSWSSSSAQLRSCSPLCSSARPGQSGPPSNAAIIGGGVSTTLPPPVFPLFRRACPADHLSSRRTLETAVRPPHHEALRPVELWL